MSELILNYNIGIAAILRVSLQVWRKNIPGGHIRHLTKHLPITDCGMRGHDGQFGAHSRCVRSLSVRFRKTLSRLCCFFIPSSATTVVLSISVGTDLTGMQFAINWPKTAQLWWRASVNSHFNQPTKQFSINMALPCVSFDSWRENVGMAKAVLQEIGKLCLAPLHAYRFFRCCSRQSLQESFIGEQEPS